MWGRLGWFEVEFWVVLIGSVGDGVCWKDVDAWRMGSEFDFGLLHMCTSTYHNFALQL